MSLAFQSALAPGSRIGAYEILAPLKAGGMATLFLGRRLGPAGFVRPVAIKIVHPHLAADRSFVEMFLDEARLSARIHHPNVVHVEELGEEGGAFYLVMEYVHGCSLAQFLRRLGQEHRGMAPEIACYIAMKVADGLHAAHETKDANGQLLGVVHRDVSPQNVLLSYDGHVKLIDFGVAKARGRSQETDAGSMKGKLRYMAPEQAWGQAVDRRSDVYALGIVLWESLTHRRLFAASDDFAALEQVRSPNIVKPSEFVSGISPGLDEAVMVALASDPAARFQSAQAFRRAISGGCAGVSRIEAEDLSALLVTAMREEIERERMTAPPTLTPVLAVPTPRMSRTTEAMRTYTMEVPAHILAEAERASSPFVPGQSAQSDSESGVMARASLPSIPNAAPAREAYTSAGAIARASEVPTVAARSSPSSASAQSTDARATSPMQPAQPTQATSGGSRAWMLALALVVVAATGGALWLWHQASAPAVTTASAPPPPTTSAVEVTTTPTATPPTTPPETSVASAAPSTASPVGATSMDAPTEGPPSTSAADAPHPTHAPAGEASHRHHEPIAEHAAAPTTSTSTSPPPSSGAPSDHDHGHVPFISAPTF